MSAHWIGYVGLISFALAWIPQCIDTVRAGHCPANRSFLLLAAIGSVSLTAYAVADGNLVFSALNALTTLGASLNLYYSVFPRA